MGKKAAATNDDEDEEEGKGPKAKLGPAPETVRETAAVLTGKPAHAAELKATLQGANMSAADKGEQLKLLEDQMAQLQQTRDNLKKEILESAPNITRSRFQKSWAALQKLATIIMLIFKQVWAQIWSFVNTLVSSSATDKEAEREIAASVKVGKPWYQHLADGIKTVVGWAWTAAWGTVKFLARGLRFVFGHAFDLSNGSSPNLRLRECHC